MILSFAKSSWTIPPLSVKTVGAENIPTEGGAIFAANHPLGGTDALAILVSIGSLQKRC